MAAALFAVASISVAKAEDVTVTAANPDLSSVDLQVVEVDLVSAANFIRLQGGPAMVFSPAVPSTAAVVNTVSPNSSAWIRPYDFAQGDIVVTARHKDGSITVTTNYDFTFQTFIPSVPFVSIPGSGSRVAVKVPKGATVTGVDKNKNDIPDVLEGLVRGANGRFVHPPLPCGTRCVIP